MSSTGRSKHRKLNKKAERLLAEKEAATLLQAQRLQQATTAVQGGMGRNAAACQFGVPPRSLSRHLRTPDIAAHGSAPRLTRSVRILQFIHPPCPHQPGSLVFSSFSNFTSRTKARLLSGLNSGPDSPSLPLARLLLRR